jgi:adenylate kinase family enzyme
VRRISVVGSSGSGKTTVARRLGRELGLSHVELDSIHHLPDWTSMPRDDFRAHVAEVVAGDGWVVDGNYRAVRDLVWDRADTVVWLDLPRATTTARVLRRTLRRTLTRQELWNGNHEVLRNLVRRDPEKNIVLWAWTKQPLLREQYAAALADVPDTVHRLHSPREVRWFLRSLPAPAARPAPKP